ncbi:MAG: DNA helicase [Oscillospiraceae bacterium]|nr:DNA helicase [Oscillospiraceae bacterium]
MAEKENILEAWIMVEHLSEGDFNPNDTSKLFFRNFDGKDFYSYFSSMIDAKLSPKNKKGGLVVYCDIFNFNEVIEILRKKFDLKPTEDEIRIGSKFSFALCFDKKLDFMSDMTFFTESAYIRYYDEVPYEDEFRSFENKFKMELTQSFNDASGQKDKFNKVMLETLERYEISLDNCRIQVVENIETDATNLHSFYIDDLEAAKSISTDNLEAYLFGCSEPHVNLDSKKDSPNFDPQIFESILRPENYPAGRFPTNTKFALSFMQQVAVNLATGYDDRSIRSVNGPPGTGKTSLLKDIFAELAVRQAKDISELKDKYIAPSLGKDKNDEPILGVLPECIAENGIVVASSNNGAVQNIVNELPLIGGIDENLIDELKEADYFMELSNSELSVKWEEDENGRKHQTLISEKKEDRFWGLYSLEGGKSDNMTNIITSVKHIAKYLKSDDFDPDPGIYREFTEQYKRLTEMRKKARELSEKSGEYARNRSRLSKLSAEYEAELLQRKKALSDKVGELDAVIEKCRAEYLSQKAVMDKISAEKENIRNNKQLLAQCQASLSAVDISSLSQAEMADHRARLNSVADQLVEIMNDERQCLSRERTAAAQLNSLTEQGKTYGEKKKRLCDEHNEWEAAKADERKALESEIMAYEDELGSGAGPLDMGLDYEELQLSNPWFGEEYRKAQSRLFILALRVRKQFLFENIKNISTASMVWGRQNEYIDEKEIITAAWGWINMCIPVISSTFASFGRMCRNLGENTLGHLFIDEAGQALPQAAVGAVLRSRNVMAVGDPSQIKPVLTLDPSILRMLGKHYRVSEKYLSDSASAQTLVDSASRYGYYRDREMTEDSRIGIPLWVHRRCRYPMFDISNELSYGGLMVQSEKEFGKTGWFDVRGKAEKKYVKEQGEFLVRKIKKMMEENPKIGDKNEKDVIYVITPFANVAYQLAQKLKEINFTRFKNGKPVNVGTIHTFQGKEAPIVFMVLGADSQSSGAAKWAVSEPNMMNVAATRAKKEFYVIGDKRLYLSLHCDVAMTTYSIIDRYGKDHPELTDNNVDSVMDTYQKPVTAASPANTAAPFKQTPSSAVQTDRSAAAVSAVRQPAGRVTGRIYSVRDGKTTKYAYAKGGNGATYIITEKVYAETADAEGLIAVGNTISFIPYEYGTKLYAKDISRG